MQITTASVKEPNYLIMENVWIQNKNKTIIVLHSHYLLHSLHWWWRVLIPAQIDNDPCDVPEEGDGDGRVDEGQERFDNSK